MKRSLWLVLSATAVVWVLLLLDMRGGGRGGTPAALASEPAPQPARSPQAGASVDAASSQTDTAVIGELGEGELSPEFKELEQRYGTEARDGSWAEQQEQRLGALFADRAMKASLVLLNCQRTICRLVLQGSEPDLFAQLLLVPKLQQETGLGTRSPYSLRSGQLSLYFRRDRSDDVAAAQ